MSRPAAAILGSALAIQLGLMVYLGDRFYGDVLKGVSFAHFVDIGAWDASRDVVNSKTMLGPWLVYRLFSGGGIAALRAANAVSFVLLGLLVLALGRRRFDDATRLVALFLFAFYPGTARSIAAGELEDHIATLLLAAGALAFLERGTVVVTALLVGIAFLFKFWGAIFGCGFIVFLLVTGRVRAVPAALVGLGLPFALLSLVDGGASIHAFFVSFGLSSHYSTWGQVAFKCFSTGLLPAAILTAVAWAESERRDVDTLLLCLGSAYPVYVLAMRDAFVATTMMMTVLVFSSHLLAAWLVAHARRLAPPARRAATLAGLVVYSATATLVAVVNLHRDTVAIRIIDVPEFRASEQMRRRFRYNAPPADAPAPPAEAQSP